MKKFFGVIVALVMCVCLMVPSAFAADTSSILDDIDLGGLTSEDLSAIFADMNLGDIDIDTLLADIEGGDEDALAMLEDALAQLEGEVTTTSSTGSVDGSLDLGAIEDAVAGDTSAITDMLSGLTSGDMSSLMDTISGAFGGAGIDLGSFDLGSFDIASLLSGAGSGSESAEGGDVASGATDMVTGIMDTLMGGLEALGLDTTMIEGLLDNDIVNFFANMYIGFIGEVPEETTAAPTTAPSTTKPAVVTTETPKTGDTSAVIVAIATISVASAAAFVCLKKKKD